MSVRVLPESERPPASDALCKAPVPLPISKPERVVEPVPPRLTASVPSHWLVKVCVLPDAVMVRPMLVSLDVANICVEPVCVCPAGPSAVMPPGSMPSVDVETYSQLPLASDRRSSLAAGVVEVPVPP